MNDKHFRKRSCLERARALLAMNDDTQLGYAALELRMCLEVIVYEKLEFFASMVPGQVLQKWQPAHALRMLLQFEPYTDEPCQVFIGKEISPGVPAPNMRSLGEYRPFGLKWLEKQYNKLGSYLHVPHGRTRELDGVKVRRDLDAIVDEIASVLSSSISEVGLASRVPFTCGVCGEISLANVDGLKNSNVAVCVSQSCGAEHFAQESDGKWTLKLNSSEFACLKCGNVVNLENRFLKIEYGFKCGKCDAAHLIVGRQWQYGLIDPASKPNSADGDQKEPNA